MKTIPLNLMSRTVEVNSPDSELLKKIDSLIEAAGGELSSNDSLGNTYIVPLSTDLVDLDEDISAIQTPQHSEIDDWEGWDNHPPEEEDNVDMWASKGYKYYPGYSRLLVTF